MDLGHFVDWPISIWLVQNILYFNNFIEICYIFESWWFPLIKSKALIHGSWTAASTFNKKQVNIPGKSSDVATSAATLNAKPLPGKLSCQQAHFMWKLSSCSRDVDRPWASLNLRTTLYSMKRIGQKSQCKKKKKGPVTKGIERSQDPLKTNCKVHNLKLGSNQCAPN